MPLPGFSAGLHVGLIDTGAILSIIDANERHHSACREALKSVRLPLLTTEAVLTETFHLAGKNPHHVERAWAFVRSGAILMSTIGNEELPQIHALMAQYSDRPMDFADATLVYLAARERLSLIFTIDHDDFSTYRLPRRKKFTILPRPERS